MILGRLHHARHNIFINAPVKEVKKRICEKERRELTCDEITAFPAEEGC
jgi:hypothetical protein